MELNYISIDMIQKVFINLLDSYEVIYTLPALKRISGKLPNDIVKIEKIVRKINEIFLRDKVIFNLHMCNLEELRSML